MPKFRRAAPLLLLLLPVFASACGLKPHEVDAKRGHPAPAATPFYPNPATDPAGTYTPPVTATPAAPAAPAPDAKPAEKTGGVSK